MRDVGKKDLLLPVQAFVRAARLFKPLREHVHRARQVTDLVVLMKGGARLVLSLSEPQRDLFKGGDGMGEGVGE